MHISEGVLSLPVLTGGVVLAVTGTALGLRRVDYDRLVTVAILSAAFFVGSLIRVPIGPSAAHLILNGLVGAVLGWASFPAILVALALQAVLFQYGGITALGVNCFDMAAPAVICWVCFRPLLIRSGPARSVGAFLCGAVSVLLAGLFTAGALALTDESFLAVAKTILLAHIPVMLLEGGFTVLVVGFLAKSRPEFFNSGAA